METLIAIAVVVATLRAHPAPPAAESPKPAVTETYEGKAGKPKPRTKAAPSLGY